MKMPLSALIGLILTGLFLFCAIFADLIITHDPDGLFPGLKDFAPEDRPPVWPVYRPNPRWRSTATRQAATMAWTSSALC